MSRVLILIASLLLLTGCSTVQSNAASATQTTLDTAVSSTTQGIINDINH